MGSVIEESTYNPVDLRLLEHMHALVIIEAIHSTYNARFGFGVGQAQDCIDVGLFLGIG
jgi:hypothetical protein